MLSKDDKIMNERTAEEKLRQTLEGDVSGDATKRSPKRVIRRIKKPDIKTNKTIVATSFKKIPNIFITSLLFIFNFKIGKIKI